jgi:hypothetical protein
MGIQFLCYAKRSNGLTAMLLLSALLLASCTGRLTETPAPLPPHPCSTVDPVGGNCCASGDGVTCSH